MAIDIEPGKALLPYLQRADELQRHEPLVAYYCRLYAMERGLHIPQLQRTKTTNSLLVSLMNQLEQDKKKLNLGPDDSLHLEGFALNVFEKADKQDRAGKIDLNTAKTFYAASVFFDVLNQFGEPQPDFEQKQKYAVWRAADIRKAIKEGRKPEPGNHQVVESPKAPVETSEDVNWKNSSEAVDPSSPMNLRPPSSTFFRSPETGPFPPSDYHPPPVPSQSPTSSEQANLLPPPAAGYTYPSFQSYPTFPESSFPEVDHPSQQYTPSYYQGLPPSSFSGQHSAQSWYQPTPETIAEAHKAARFAVGALAFDDVSAAVDYLRKSLGLLTHPGNPL